MGVSEGKLNIMVATFSIVTINEELQSPFYDRTGLTLLKYVNLMGNRGAIDRAWLGNQESCDELSIEDRPNLYFERSGDLVGIVAVLALRTSLFKALISAISKLYCSTNGSVVTFNGVLQGENHNRRQ